MKANMLDAIKLERVTKTTTRRMKAKVDRHHTASLSSSTGPNVFTVCLLDLSDLVRLTMLAPL